MASKAGLKAGLIGAALAVVVILLGQIPVPFLNCACCGLAFLVYVAAGALAGHFLPPPRKAGTAAGVGAIAGLLTGVVSGIAWAIIIAIQSAGGGAPDVLQMLDPETLRQLTELGIDPQSYAGLAGTTGVAVAAVGCCLTSLAGGAGLGAIGGLLYGVVKSD